MSSTEVTSIGSNDELSHFPPNESQPKEYKNETNSSVENFKPSKEFANNKGEDETDFVNSESIVSKRLTIAGGFLDFALFSANVEHLKFVIETGHLMKHQELLLSLLIISLVLQLITGVLLFTTGFRKTNHITKEQASAGTLWNQIVIGLVTIIAIVNVFITIFGDRGSAVEQLLAKCEQTLTTKLSTL